MHHPAMLGEAERRLLATTRRAILVTVDDRGLPRPVPVTFALLADVLWTPIDDKPKATDDPRALARVRDIEARPDVVVLADHWSEDWTELAWLRVHGRASLVEPGEPGHAEAVGALRERYAQYRTHRLDARPVIRIELRASRSWSASG